MNENEQALMNYMVVMDTMFSRIFSNTSQEKLVYKNLYALVLKNGRFFAPPKKPGVPKDVRPGPDKECYRNTSNNVSEKYTYTEGYAFVKGLPLAFEHAWLTTESGQVVDPTWTDGQGTAYFGVPLNNKWMWKMVYDSGYWGVLHNFANMPALLENGLPPQATQQESDND